MSFINRNIFDSIQTCIQAKKSLLLLGPRQTGKTTLLKQLPFTEYINLLLPKNRLRYETRPEIFYEEVTFLAKKNPFPLIILDEVQKLPTLLDTVQILVDEGIAQFALTGSSVRKLRQAEANLLPGRLLSFHLDPLSLNELPEEQQNLDNLLYFGSLPEVITSPLNLKIKLLQHYVFTYLEEEVRQEAIVRKLGAFSRFVELAASESGQLIHFSKLSREIGVSHVSIRAYFQILEDCFLIKRIPVWNKAKVRRTLNTAERYLFFDMGIRRFAAQEGMPLPRTSLGKIFEHFIGLELLKLFDQESPGTKLYFWRDDRGMEIDWIIETAQKTIPIEVKLTATPNDSDSKTLRLFMKEQGLQQGYLICTAPKPYALNDQILVLPWQRLSLIKDTIR